MKKIIDCIWNNTNIANKTLTLLGAIALVETVFTLFFDSNQTSPNDVAVRSIMSSIFGYIFGSQVSTRDTYNREIQTLIASIVSTICLIVVMIAHWTNMPETGAASVELRNLLFAAVGFLISRGKNNLPPKE